VVYNRSVGTLLTYSLSSLFISKTEDDVAFNSRSARTLPQNPNVMPYQFEELGISSGLEKAASYPMAYEQMAKV